MDNIIITDEKKLNAVKRAIFIDGPGKLQVVSDFDKTLTSCFVDGKKIVSLISILRDEHYLTSDYSAKAQALFDKYHPIEINPKISRKEKAKAMHEWWTTHYKLLIKSGLSRKDLEKAAQTPKVAFRPGAMEFLDFLHKHKIPLVILSASGMGTETISLYLKRFVKLYDNIKIASNEFIWENDKVVGIKKPIIHSFNKDYTSVKRLPFFKEVKDRKNVILLGDSIDDTRMMKGFDYKNIIKIGFLNENEKGEIAKYKKNFDTIILKDGPMDYVLKPFVNAFDVIILNDGPMDFVNLLMRELVEIK